MPIRQEAQPPIRASATTAVSASAMSAHPSRDRMILVGHRPHDRADVEGPLAVRVSLGREDVADRGEARAGVVMRVAGDVPRDRVGGHRAARRGLTWGDVGVRVVGTSARREQRPGWVALVLGLPVRPHHSRVPADAEVVLRGHAAGEVQRLLAGEHHRGRRGHNEDAPGVHEHGGLGVPVRLGADVDAGHHDIDLAACLGELDDPP